MELREPKLICASGMKGVGKTFSTNLLIRKYVKNNPSTGKKGRKVLIYDINMEYTDYKALAIKDIPRFTRQKRVEVRRILPVNDDGREASLSEMLEILTRIINNYRGGMLILEDINRYLVQSKTTDVIGLLATNRHRDLDIICHFQSLSALDPRMWQNVTEVRFHMQTDDIDRYRRRIPNYELFKIAQCLVRYKYLKAGDKRFFCYVAVADNYITGDFSQKDFHIACQDYLQINTTKVNQVSKKYGKGLEADAKAKQVISQELFQMYYQGL